MQDNTQDTVKIRTIIVDDEPLARSRLLRLLASQHRVEVIAEAVNGQEAINLVKQLKPDLVFLDIQMPVKTGLQAAQEIAQLPQQKPAIIYCTAYDQYAVEAFQTQATAYLMKPVSNENLQEAIMKATELSQLQLTQLDNQLESPYLAIQHTDYIEKVKADELLYFRAQDKQTVAGLNSGDEIIVDYTLKEIEHMFAEFFIRVHRNSLINKTKIERLGKEGTNTPVVSVSGCELIFPVSRRHLSEVKNVFK